MLFAQGIFLKLWVNQIERQSYVMGVAAKVEVRNVILISSSLRRMVRFFTLWELRESIEIWRFEFLSIWVWDGGLIGGVLAVNTKVTNGGGSR